jgi:hypothetical protein
MEPTKYWSKKQTFFSCKCEDQKDLNDGRQLRKYTNPQTNEPGEVWEYQSQKFNGLCESFYIEEQEFDGRKTKNLCFGMQGDGYVNVLKFKLFKAKGGLTKDIMKIARVIQGINFSKELFIEVWENFKRAEKDENGKMQVPVYLMFKRNVGETYPQSYPSAFAWDDDNKVFTGVPAVETRESMGETIYDSTKRDEFYYAIIEKAIADNKAILEENKSMRQSTPAEAEKAAPVPADDIEDDVNF